MFYTHHLIKKGPLPSAIEDKNRNLEIPWLTLATHTSHVTPEGEDADKENKGDKNGL